MKYNLKNRPKCWVEEKEYPNNVEGWFEGFEKELRKIIEELGNDEYPRHWIAIEEILGDT